MREKSVSEKSTGRDGKKGKAFFYVFHHVTGPPALITSHLSCYDIKMGCEIHLNSLILHVQTYALNREKA